jgi:hypothetical protein
MAIKQNTANKVVSKSTAAPSGSIEGITRLVYEAVVDEVGESVGNAVKDALSDLERKLMETIRHEVEHRVKSLVTSYEMKVLQNREDYVKSLESLVKSMPKKSKVQKSIVYGQSGRPEKIVEETSEE